MLLQWQPWPLVTTDVKKIDVEIGELEGRRSSIPFYPPLVHIGGRLGIQPLFGDELVFSPERLSGGERGPIFEQRLDTEPTSGVKRNNSNVITHYSLFIIHYSIFISNIFLIEENLLFRQAGLNVRKYFEDISLKCF